MYGRGRWCVPLPPGGTWSVITHSWWASLSIVRGGGGGEEGVEGVGSVRRGWGVPLVLGKSSWNLECDHSLLVGIVKHGMWGVCIVCTCVHWEGRGDPGGTLWVSSNTVCGVCMRGGVDRGWGVLGYYFLPKPDESHAPWWNLECDQSS